MLPSPLWATSSEGDVETSPSRTLWSFLNLAAVHVERTYLMTFEDPFFVFRGQPNLSIWQHMDRRYVMGKILLTTGEWTNIGEEEPQCAFLEIYPGKVYASIWSLLTKIWSYRRPLYTLHCSILLYVCHRNRRDSFLTQERKVLCPEEFIWGTGF